MMAQGHDDHPGKQNTTTLTNRTIKVLLVQIKIHFLFKFRSRITIFFFFSYFRPLSILMLELSRSLVTISAWGQDGHIFEKLLSY